MPFERLLEDFAEIASDWFWEMDADLRFSYFSSRLAEVAGVEPDREVGKSRLDIAANATDRAFWQAHIDDLLARRPFRDLVYPYSHRDGSVRCQDQRPLVSDQRVKATNPLKTKEAALRGVARRCRLL